MEPRLYILVTLLTCIHALSKCALKRSNYSIFAISRNTRALSIERSVTKGQSIAAIELFMIVSRIRLIISDEENSSCVKADRLDRPNPFLHSGSRDHAEIWQDHTLVASLSRIRFILHN